MSDGIQQSPDEIITQIQMAVTDKIWLILEGTTDERLLRVRPFSKKIESVVAQGWKNVVEIVKGCEGKNFNSKIVLGLIDRDYRDLDGKQIYHQNIILTDYRDIENMLFETKALLKIYSTYGSFEKLPKKNDDIDIEKIKSNLNSVAYKLGMFKAYCYFNHVEISFENIDHKKFIDSDKISLDDNKFIKNLNGHNPGKESLIGRIKWQDTQSGWIPTDKEKSPAYIRHGHDLMEIIAISLKKKWGSRGGSCNRKEVEEWFCIAVEDEELKQYKFWKDIEAKIT